MPLSHVWIDPGLGFHKNATHSFSLLSGLRGLKGVGAGLVVGASRKSFLARDVPSLPAERVGASVAAALVAAQAGTHVLRVHDVIATRQALAVVGACGWFRTDPSSAQRGVDAS
jgi:dihydropteroate synthase